MDGDLRELRTHGRVEKTGVEDEMWYPSPLLLSPRRGPGRGESLVVLFVPAMTRSRVGRRDSMDITVSVPETRETMVDVRLYRKSQRKVRDRRADVIGAKIYGASGSASPLFTPCLSLPSAIFFRDHALSLSADSSSSFFTTM